MPCSIHRNGVYFLQPRSTKQGLSYNSNIIQSIGTAEQVYLIYSFNFQNKTLNINEHPKEILILTERQIFNVEYVNTEKL